RNAKAFAPRRSAEASRSICQRKRSRDDKMEREASAERLSAERYRRQTKTFADETIDRGLPCAREGVGRHPAAERRELNLRFARERLARRLIEPIARVLQQLRIDRRETIEERPPRLAAQ